MERIQELFLPKIYLFIMLFAAYLFYDSYELKTKELKRLEDQIVQTQKQIKTRIKKRKEIQKFLDDIENAKKRVENVAQQVEAAQRQFPSTVSDAEILDFMLKESKLLNIKDMKVEPGKEVNKGFYFIREYKALMTAHFYQVLVLVERIGEAERLLNIPSIEIKSYDITQKTRFPLVKVDLKIQAYRHNANYREDRGIKKIEEQFNNKKKKNNRKKRRPKGK